MADAELVVQRPGVLHQRRAPRVEGGWLLHERRLVLVAAGSQLPSGEPAAGDAPDAIARWSTAKAGIHDLLGTRLFLEDVALSLPAGKDQGGHKAKTEARCVGAVSHLEEQIAAARGVAGDAPLLVVIDSLQKLPMSLEERRAGVDGWLRELERLRTKYDAVILVISELARASSGEGVKTGITAFKESGGCEYAAELAMTLARENVADLRAPAVLEIVKRRARQAERRGPCAAAGHRPAHDEETLPVDAGGSPLTRRVGPPERWGRDIDFPRDFRPW